jgi:hypothetical protein
LRELTETAVRVRARLGQDSLAQSAVAVDEQRNLVIGYTWDDPNVQTRILRSAALNYAVVAEVGRVVTEPLPLGVTLPWDPGATKQGVAASSPELAAAPSPDPDCRIPLPPSGLCEQPPMRGGLRLDVPRQDSTVGGCTMGFNVEGVGRGNPNERYTLTAGHCVLGHNDDDHNHDWIDHTYHRGIPVGVEDRGLVTRDPDFAIMPHVTKGRKV